MATFIPNIILVRQFSAQKQCGKTHIKTAKPYSLRCVANKVTLTHFILLIVDDSLPLATAPTQAKLEFYALQHCSFTLPKSKIQFFDNSACIIFAV